MGNLFKKYSINFVYLWSTFIFVVIIFTIMIWISYSYSVKNIVDVTTNNQIRSLSLLDQILKASFNNIESISLSLIVRYDLWDVISAPKSTQKMLSYKTVQEYANKLIFSNPLVYTIDFYVKDPPPSSDNDLVRFLSLSELKNLPRQLSSENSDFYWIGEHSTESYMGDISIISFVRKMYSNSGDYQGAVIINIAVSEIQKLLLDPNLEVKRMFFDSNGQFITQVGFSTKDLDQSKNYISPNSLIQSSQNNFKGHKQINNEYLVVWLKQTNTGMMIVEITPWNELVASTEKMAIILVYILLFAVIILFLFFIFVNRSFTSPIYILLRIMKQFPKEFDQRLPEDYKNEFGQLFTGYGNLLAKIKELNESLKAQYEKKRESEIKALQSQINPHFLYNTLNQLNWMAIKEGSNKLSRVIELIGNMLRIGLSGDQTMIQLSKEIEHVESYLQIQRIRFGDQLTYSIQISDDMRSFLVPKVILQPIVENSIRHGFHGLRGGNIQIHCQLSNDEIVIKIEDDGVGLQLPLMDFKPSIKGGYGIYNVKERLITLYGPGNRFEIYNRIEGGTTVIFRLPMIEE